MVMVVLAGQRGRPGVLQPEFGIALVWGVARPGPWAAVRGGPGAARRRVSLQGSLQTEHGLHYTW